MMNEEEINKIRSFTEMRTNGNLLRRWKLYRKKNKVLNRLTDLEVSMFDYYENKIEKDIEEIKKDTKMRCNKKIKETAEEEEYNEKDILTSFP